MVDERINDSSNCEHSCEQIQSPTVETLFFQEKGTKNEKKICPIIRIALMKILDASQFYRSSRRCKQSILTNVIAPLFKISVSVLISTNKFSTNTVNINMCHIGTQHYRIIRYCRYKSESLKPWLLPIVNLKREIKLSCLHSQEEEFIWENSKK